MYGNLCLSDADFGPNAELSYRIQRGSFNDFSIDADTGMVVTAGQLDFDRRSSYEINIVAVDKGTPSLSGEVTDAFLQSVNSLNLDLY